MTIAIGMDPDTKSTGLAVVSKSVDNGVKVLEAVVVRAKGAKAPDRLPVMCESIYTHMTDLIQRYNPSVIVLEWQAIRPCDRRPNDILHLSVTLGAALAAIGLRMNLEIPLPVKWRGSVKKEILHQRLLKKLGLTLDSDEFRGILSSQKSHVIDAIGLALYGLNKES